MTSPYAGGLDVAPQPKTLSRVKSGATLPGFGRRITPGLPQESLQIASSSVVELHPFAFQHPLLFIRGQHNASGGTFALRINHAVPRSIPLVSAVHDEA